MPTLNWIGKDKVITHHQDVAFRVLDHQYGYTPDGKQAAPVSSGNLIIHGDNLEALKALLPQYEAKVKCIYIDPPYNTGNEGWVYNDNVNDPKIRKWLHQVVGKEGEDLSRHDKWLCMMYPRLVLLHKLLSAEGVLFASIDDNEQANLTLLLNEIFGPTNFIATIAVVNNLKGRSDDKFIASSHESLVIFKKRDFKTHGVVVPDEYVNEYKLKDDHGYYRLQGLRKRGSNSRREDRPNLYYPFYYNLQSHTLSLTKPSVKEYVEIFPRLSDGSDGNWRWGRETANERMSELTAELVKGRNEFDVFQKDYLHVDGGLKTIKPKSVWLGSEFSSDAGTKAFKDILPGLKFNNPKAPALLTYILQQATKNSDIVLDSFAGSGTTGHAVLNLNKVDGGNRKCILVEMEDYAETITAERVKRVIHGYADVEGTGGCFDYYELGPPMFDDSGNLNEQVPANRIREYVWYSETRSAFIELTDEQKRNRYFLGVKDDTGYYFYYEQQQLTTLDYDFLGTIYLKAEQYVIYADNCLLSKTFMQANNITFKKIPRDISRL
jgi:adenine-specific DNA-methyltransferase